MLGSGAPSNFQMHVNVDQSVSPAAIFACSMVCFYLRRLYISIQNALIRCLMQHAV